MNTIVRKPFLVGVLALTVVVCRGSAFGQDTANWIDTTGLWNNSANWSCVIGGVTQACVPNGNINVGIENGGAATLDINATTGTLTLDAGSSLGVGTGLSLNSGKGFIGYSSGSNGSATVTGVGAVWNADGLLDVGESGQGTLTISGGGQVNTLFSNLGTNAGSQGTVTVSGSGSQWHFADTGGFAVGGAGNGTLTITNGGVVGGGVMVDAGIANGPASVSSVTVSGAGSQLNLSSLGVGGFGQGTLMVTDGGLVSGGYVAIGAGSGSGSATVDGTGSQLTTGGIVVGNNGQGALTIQNGGVVNSASGNVGFASGSVGTVTVTGAGSQWNITGPLTIGGTSGGQGTLSVQQGGAVTSGDLTNLGNPGPSAIIVNSSTLTVNGDFINDTSTMSIQNGSTVKIAGGVSTSRPAATFTLDNSTLTVGGGFFNGGTTTTIQNGSTMMIGGGLTNDVGGYSSAELNINRSNVTISGDLHNVAGAIGAIGIQNGSTVVVGGTLMNEFGTLTVDNSGLAVGGDFSNEASASNIQNGGTVTVSGTLTNDFGTLTLDNSGLTVDTDVNNQASATSNVQNGAVLNVSGNLNNSINSMLNITLSSGATVVSALTNDNSTVAVDDSSTLTVKGDFNNQNSAVTNTTGSSTLNANANFNNSGGSALNVLSGGSLNVASTFNNTQNSSFNLTDGSATVGVAGTKTRVLTNAGSTITVDDSALTVNGGFLNEGLGGVGATTNIRDGATLTAFSILNVNGPASFNVTSGSAVTANLMDNSSGATLTVDASTLTLSDAPSLGAVGTLSTDYLATTNIQNGATLKATVVWNTNGGVLNINNATVDTKDLWNMTGATLNGSGTIKGNVHNTGGTIDVSDPGMPSLLTINGNYTQGSNGTLLIDILGTGAGQYSVLDVTGTATLDGTLDINFINGFTAGSFNFLDFGSLVGDFSSVDIVGGLCDGCSDTIVIRSGEITLDTKTPEPASLLLLGTALLGIAAVVRRLNAHHA